MRELFRVPTNAPVTAFKTYALSLPKQTHYRKATCQEVDCEAYANGWVTKIDVTTDLGQRQAKYIRDHSGRTFQDVTAIGSPVREFMFPSGQQCFADHQVPLERDPIFVVRDGDWRGNPTGRRMQHAKAQDWIDDFGEHQQNIADAKEKG
jgi:hypothetical protein